MTHVKGFKQDYVYLKGFRVTEIHPLSQTWGYCHELSSAMQNQATGI